MRVLAHSDPFLVDWHSDGDLDLLSGSAQGGAFLFVNVGSRYEPEFAEPKTLVEPVGHDSRSDTVGDGHLKGPGSSTLVWADDLDGDGKLDLLLGDDVTLYHTAKGVEASVALAELGEWRAALSDLDEEKPDDFGDRYRELEKARNEFVEEDRTGFVWLLCQK